MNALHTTRLAVAVVLATVSIGVASQARAVTLIPPSMEFTADPGEVITTKVKLFNETAETVVQYSSIANFAAKDETGVPEFSSDNDLTNLAGWITFLETGPWTLEPGARVEVPIEIRVPADAEPGGHYAGVFFSAAPPAPGSQTQIAIASKVGSLVLVRVEGQIQESGTVVEFGTAEGKTSFSRLPVGLVLRMSNTGNVHFRPTGKVVLRNMLGGTTTELAVNPTKGAVLPASVRRFDMNWEKFPNTEDRGNFFQEIGREWSNFALGPYTASLALTYGQASDKSATATFQFWVFPWRILLVSLLVIAGLVIALVYAIRGYNRWIISKAGKTGK